MFLGLYIDLIWVNKLLKQRFDLELVGTKFGAIRTPLQQLTKTSSNSIRHPWLGENLLLRLLRI